MSAQLDIDDVTADHPLARAELARLRAELAEAQEREEEMVQVASRHADSIAALRAEVDALKHDNARLVETCAEQATEVESLLEVLDFYADEATYHAMVIVADPPCGDFITDFSVDEGSEYERPMPGRRARAALRGEARQPGPAEENEPC